MAEKINKMAVPKKKKRVKAMHHAPFPIPIRSITKEYENYGKSYVFSGDLIGSSVIVNQSGDMHYLYNMGFFGKGNLSRSGIQHEAHIPTVSNTKGDSLRVMKRQSYIRHLNWQKQKQCKESGNEVFYEMKEYDSEEECGYFQGGSWEQRAGYSQNEDYAGTWNNDGNMCEDNPLTNTDEDLTSNTEGFEYDWKSEKQNQETFKVADWDAQEADHNFWGSDCAQSKNEQVLAQDKAKSDNVMDDWNSQEVDTDFWSTDSASKVDNKCKKLTMTENVDAKANDFIHPDQNFWSENKTACSNKMTQSTEKLTSKLGQIESCSLEENIEKNSDNDSLGNHKNSENDPFQSKTVQGTESAQHPEKDQSETTRESVENSNQPMKSLDPLCESHDQDGDVLLVSDSEDEISANKKADVTWKRVVKCDPYRIKEHLQLSLSEAFFLSYGLGCFVCYSQNKTAMHLMEMWRTFIGLEKTFLPTYIAYHYFRSKGWVPKSGLKFGVDFILYKEGPPFYHASFSVIVRLVDSMTLKDNPESVTRSLNWTSLSGLNRITENVAKELLMCFVVRPSDLSDEDLLSPACIKQFKVKEVLMKRWIPSQERENKNEDIL